MVRYIAPLHVSELLNYWKPIFNLIIQKKNKSVPIKKHISVMHRATVVSKGVLKVVIV